MVRHYKRKYTNIRRGKNHKPYCTYTADALRNAAQQVKSRTLTLKQASEKYQVPITTIHRHISSNSGEIKKPGHPNLFSDAEENAFVEHLNIVSEWGFPFDSMDLRLLAKGYLDRKGIEIPFLKNNCPGSDWISGFLKRHKKALSMRFAANISSNRAKLTQEVIDAFFKNAGEVLKDINPSNIINYDETNLTDDPKNKKIICKRGTKYPERVINSSKTAISLMYSGAADGTILPTYVVYKAEHLWDTWLHGGPPGTRYNRSKSGWFDSICFEDWFNKIAVPYFSKLDGKKVMIGDNLSSHFSVTTLQKCKDLDISFICLPPNATHVMQPLDVAFYAPLKQYWSVILTDWKKTTGRREKYLSKDVFPLLLCKLNEKLMGEDKGSANIISGFNKCGLVPLDPSKPKARVKSSNPLNDSTNSSSLLVSDVVIEMLGELRHGGEVKKPRRKKVNVEPGKSVSADDLITPSTSGTETQPQPNQVPRRKRKRAPSPPSSEDSEDSDGPSSVEETENSESSDEGEDEVRAVPVCSEGQWVIVEYETIKNACAHYVGKIARVIKDTSLDGENQGPESDPDICYEVQFLKKLPKSADGFTQPSERDIDEVSHNMISQILAPPQEVGTGSRKVFKFTEDLSKFRFI